MEVGVDGSAGSGMEVEVGAVVGVVPDGPGGGPVGRSVGRSVGRRRTGVGVWTIGRGVPVVGGK